MFSLSSFPQSGFRPFSLSRGLSIHSGNRQSDRLLQALLKKTSKRENQSSRRFQTGQTTQLLMMLLTLFARSFGNSANGADSQTRPTTQNTPQNATTPSATLAGGGGSSASSTASIPVPTGSATPAAASSNPAVTQQNLIRISTSALNMNSVTSIPSESALVSLENGGMYTGRFILMGGNNTVVDRNPGIHHIEGFVGNSGQDRIFLGKNDTSFNTIETFGGDDLVVLSGQNVTGAQVSMGEGNDQLFITKPGSLVNIVDMGAGSDKLFYSKDTISNYGLPVELGTGDDEVHIEPPTKRTVATFNGGDGNDTFVIHGDKSEWTETKQEDGSTLLQHQPSNSEITLNSFENIEYTDEPIPESPAEPVIPDQ